jgi:hypothetical protein
MEGIAFKPSHMYGFIFSFVLLLVGFQSYFRPLFLSLSLSLSLSLFLSLSHAKIKTLNAKRHVISLGTCTLSLVKDLLYCLFVVTENVC